jgi:mono/diheme cytochrome c family protein
MMKVQTILLLALLGASLSALAEPRSIELPEETARLRQVEHAGYALAVQKCSICHSADYISLQPPGMNLKQWSAEVGKMQHAFGAPITDEEAKLIAEYLSIAYGSEVAAAR